MVRLRLFLCLAMLAGCGSDTPAGTPIRSGDGDGDHKVRAGVTEVRGYVV